MSQLYGGRWEVVHAIGEGGQAHTFRVRDRNSGSTDWVLKRLKNPNRLGRFEKEIRALQMLGSPRIPRIEDYSTQDSAYLVTAFVGENLDSYIIAIRPSLAERMVMFQDVVEAVRDAHSVNVIHRDVKPNNIVVSRGRGFLIDFGICQIVDGDLFVVLLTFPWVARR